jgi:hypothetical protein
MFRFKTKTLLILMTGVAFLLTLTLSVNSMTKTRVVARVDHPNGTRLRIVQAFNYGPELFTTSIYFDPGDGKWRWYYFDHQDSYWDNAESKIANGVVLFISPGREIRFDTISGECTTYHCGRIRSHSRSDRIIPFVEFASGAVNQQNNSG